MAAILNINPSKIGRSSIVDAADVIRSGGVLLYPTDTIYGLGCDAFCIPAVERIFRIKKREEGQPALVIVDRDAEVEELADGISPVARQLMKRYWPGPVTLIFRARRRLSPLLVSGEKKIGIRIPDNPFCLKLLKECRRPIVSTSANISGKPNERKIARLISTFHRQVDLIVDAGDAPTSLPSAIVDVSADVPVVLRQGVIRAEEISEFVSAFFEKKRKY